MMLELMYYVYTRLFASVGVQPERVFFAVDISLMFAYGCLCSRQQELEMIMLFVRNVT